MWRLCAVDALPLLAVAAGAGLAHGHAQSRFHCPRRSCHERIHAAKTAQAAGARAETAEPKSAQLPMTPASRRSPASAPTC